MSITRKEVKKFVDNPDNWEVIPGNQYVQVAKLKHPILCVMQIQRRYDRNQWKYITKRDDYQPEIVWEGGSFWRYDRNTDVLICSISRTEVENLIYDWEKL